MYGSQQLLEIVACRHRGCLPGAGNVWNRRGRLGDVRPILPRSGPQYQRQIVCLGHTCTHIRGMGAHEASGNRLGDRRVIEHIAADLPLIDPR